MIIGVGAIVCRCDCKNYFCPNFPKLARKVVVRLLPTNFLPQRSGRPVLVWPQGPSFVFFCRRWAPTFEVKQRWTPFLHRCSGSLPRNLGILPKFSGILPGFSTKQIFWGWAFTPCTPTSYTTGNDHVTNQMSMQRNHVKYFDWVYTRLMKIIISYGLTARSPTSSALHVWGFGYAQVWWRFDWQVATVRENSRNYAQN